MNKANTL